MRLVIVLMGVCGTGKSEISSELARRLDCGSYIEGDNYHSPHNKEKMNGGVPLTDDDRFGWLESIGIAIKKACTSSSDIGPVIVACSALRESYRAKLSEGMELQFRFVHLRGPKELIKARLEGRKHFMNPSLLDSQFETLEEPMTAALTIEVDKSVEEICDTIQKRLVEKPSWFGVCGMGVMGTSLARNLASKGVPLSLYNRVSKETNEIDVAKRLLEKYPVFSSESKCSAFDGNMEDFVNSLQTPRKILIMATAGRVVDFILELLLPYLEKGDVVIDAGNSHFGDTQRRQQDLWDRKAVHLVGCGVSGGEEGALKGPAIMPGGHRDAFHSVKFYLDAIASRDREGRPCCAFMGEGGSGHFVKTVHNGMEYAEMQLLGEVYSYLKTAHKLDNESIASCLEGWQSKFPLSKSYLLEITIMILRKKEGGEAVLDSILDKSGNKGTGNWTAVAACELGQPTTMVATALFARYLSSLKDSRVQLEQSLLPNDRATEASPLSTDTLCEAYVLAKVINHHQGMQLLDEASSPGAPEKYKGIKSLDLADICRVWTAGCILRSELLQKMRSILLESEGKAGAAALLEDPEMQTLFKTSRKAMKGFVASCIERDIAAPCFSEALQYLVGLTTARSNSSALIQAQRDCFGSHGYQRLYDDRATVYHTLWEEN